MAPKISGVDQTETIVALQKRFGTSYILYGCKSQPRQALNVILTSWGKELPVLSLGSPLPDFKHCISVQEIFKAADLWLAEYEAKIVEEAETLAEEVERITTAAAALDAKTTSVLPTGVTHVEPPAGLLPDLPVGKQAWLDYLDDAPAVDLEPVVTSVERTDVTTDDLEGSLSGVEAQTVLHAANAEVQFKGIPLTQLRKASKFGVVKNGYDKTRAELEVALYEAGVTRGAALAAK